MPIYVPPASGLLTNIIQWAIVSTDGTVHDLTWQTDRTIFVPRGTVGLGVAPTELILEKLPFMRGSKLRYVRTNPIEIELPIVISKPSLVEAMIAAANVRSWFYTGDERDNAPAYLRITRPQDNEVRQIAVYYNGGLEGDLDEGSPNYIPYVISLLAPDPTWTDTDPIELTYTNSSIGNIEIITNPGDFDAFPIYTIGGPASNIDVFNLTTGKHTALVSNGGLTLTAGGFVIIDTRPATERTTLPIIDQDGTSQYSKLTQGTSTTENWLQPGANQVRVSANGTSASTTIAVSYLPRYNGALR